jgi:hypothetical protein
MTTRWIVPTVALAAIAWVGAGWAQDPKPDKGPGQKVGEKIDGAVQDIKSGFRKAGEATREEFARAKNSVHNMGVEGRVYSRLHWDKALNDASIDLSTGSDGVLTLNGTVADANAKKRAVELAESTVGVTRVVDQLAIKPPSATTTTAP